MKYYIKPSLRELPIIDQLYNIINKYNSIWGSQSSSDQFEGYNQNLNYDPVIDFIDYMIPSDDTFDSIYPNQDRDTIIKYLSNLFYETKGTYKVLDYITEYDLFQTTDNNQKDTTTKISYTTQSIDIKIKVLKSRFDRDLFCNYLEKFLCALLYFQILDINIELVESELLDTTTSSINSGSYFYQQYILKEE